MLPTRLGPRSCLFSVVQTRLRRWSSCGTQSSANDMESQLFSWRSMNQVGSHARRQSAYLSAELQADAIQIDFPTSDSISGLGERLADMLMAQMIQTVLKMRVWATVPGTSVVVVMIQRRDDFRAGRGFNTTSRRRRRRAAKTVSYLATHTSRRSSNLHGSPCSGPGVPKTTGPLNQETTARPPTR